LQNVLQEPHKKGDTKLDFFQGLNILTKIFTGNRLDLQGCITELHRNLNDAAKHVAER
jgi:hypothetical protein